MLVSVRVDVTDIYSAAARRLMVAMRRRRLISGVRPLRRLRRTRGTSGAPTPNRYRHARWRLSIAVRKERHLAWSASNPNTP